MSHHLYGLRKMSHIIVKVIFLFAYLGFIVCHNVDQGKVVKPSKNVSSETRKKVLQTIFSARSMDVSKQKNSRIQGRTMVKKRSLPEKDLFSSTKPSLVNCGTAYNVAKEEYLYFTLGSHYTPCSYEFLGSYNERCSVAVYCAGQIKLSPAGQDGCEDEFLYLSDGTTGLMTGCGNFSFEKTPLIPHNDGKDMYIFLKADHPETKCIAMCVEDLNATDYGLNPPKKITRNQAYSHWEESTCKCGHTEGGNSQQGRVVGGSNVRPFQFPWQAAIVFPDTRMGFCGGTLVNDRYVVSAAHCFLDPESPEDIQVLLHAHILDQNSLHDDPSNNDIPGWTLPDETDESENSTRLNVVEIRLHPLYNKETYDFDVAILKLAHPVNLQNSLLRTACLPNVDEDLKYKDGEEMLVTGWGRPSENALGTSRILQKLSVPYVNLQSCRNYSSPTNRHLCNGFIEGGKDACSGDSGGPLIYRKSKHYVLAGVVSAGQGCARKDTLGLYTDVREVVQWIHFHTPGAISCRREKMKQ